MFAFALLRVLREQDPKVVHTAWFLFLGSRLFSCFWRCEPIDGSGAFHTQAVRSWQHWASPSSHGRAGHFPLTQQLLGFAPVGWREQVSIEAYSILYLIVADLLRGGFDSYMAAHDKARLGSRRVRRRPGRDV